MKMRRPLHLNDCKHLKNEASRRNIRKRSNDAGDVARGILGSEHKTAGDAPDTAKTDLNRCQSGGLASNAISRLEGTHTSVAEHSALFHCPRMLFA